jgi:hypothetical protein
MSEPLLLSPFQIRILLKCVIKPLSRDYISNSYRKYTAEERLAGLQSLIKQGMLTEQAMPKPGANRIPVFYFITDKGREWIEKYQADYPQ